MTACARIGCDRPAAFAPKLCVPVMGGRHKPLEAVLSLPVCARHAGELVADDFLGAAAPPPASSFREMFNLAAGGRFVPDFDEAYIQPVAIEGAEYRAATEAAGAVH